jgi:hypothetical protein
MPKVSQQSLDQQVKQALKPIPREKPLGLHYKVSVVALYLGKSTKWVKGKIKDGQFDGYLLDHDIVVTLESINAYLEMTRITGQAHEAAQSEPEP